jgi:hypothetical protein
MDRALEAEPDTANDLESCPDKDPGTADEQEPVGGPSEERKKDEQQRFQSFFNAAIYEENDEQISYLKLQRHIQTNHPVDEDGNLFKLTANIGSLNLLDALTGCSGAFEGADEGRHTEEKEEKRIEITRIQQQIGLGPTLFLMAAKALAWLFFLLTLLNIPVFMYYWSGDADSTANAGNTEELGLINFFAGNFVRLSLGNIGQNINAGGEANLLAADALKISCPYGRLHSLDAFGLSKDDGANARMMADSATPADLLDANCALVGVDGSTSQATVQTLFASSAAAKTLVTCFEEKCRDESSCEIEMKNSESCFPELATSLASACLTTVS